MSDVKDAERIHNLPLNGRQVSNLFNLTAGVEGGGTNTRTNGVKVGSTEMTLDGMSYVDRLAAPSRECNQASIPFRNSALRRPAPEPSFRVQPPSS